MANMRIILCANSTSKLIAPIKSRCLLMRVAAPTEDEMDAALRHVASKEKFDLPDDAAKLIVKDSAGNLRKALLVLEALKMQSCVPLHILSSPLSSLDAPRFHRTDLSSPNLSIAKPDWETYCEKIADLIIAKQSPDQIHAVRGKLYELLAHCIPPTIILKVSSSWKWDIQQRLTASSGQTIAHRVVDKVDESLKGDIMHWAAFYVRPDSSGRSCSLLDDTIVSLHRRFECERGARKYSISRRG